MDDFISRQAAIDAACDGADEWDGGRNEWRDKFITEFIETVPSAQPEIIRCKDCKYAEIADPEDNQDGYICQFHRGSIWFSESYCSWAERREYAEI